MTADWDRPSLDLLVVGPGGRETGGVARYVHEQRRRLPADVDPRVFDNAVSRGDGPVWFVLAFLVSVWNLLRFPFRRRPDVLHVHTSHGIAFYRAAGYVLFGALAWRCPVVVHVHGSSFDEFVRTDSRLVRALQNRVFGAADRVIVLSEYWEDVLSSRVPPGKLAVVPNAVDPTGYDPGFDADPPRVAFVSNHVERKGIRELVEAVRDLPDDLDFRVSIAGSGSLSHLAEVLDEADDRVEYLGYVSEEEKRQLLDDSSIYALPTYAEGLPIALLEGMGGGNAVVTTGVGAIPEVVDHSVGRTVPPGDADALRKALRDLIDDPGMVGEMARQSRKRVVEDYSWSTTVDALVDVYASVVPAWRSGTGPGRGPGPNPGSRQADPATGGSER